MVQLWRRFGEHKGNFRNRYVPNWRVSATSNAESGGNDEDRFRTCVRAAIVEAKNRNIRFANAKKRKKEGETSTVRPPICVSDVPDSALADSELPPDAPVFLHFMTTNPRLDDELRRQGTSTVTATSIPIDLDLSDEEGEFIRKNKKQKKGFKSRKTQRKKEKELQLTIAGSGGPEKLTMREDIRSRNEIAKKKAAAARLHAAAASKLAATTEHNVRLEALKAAKGHLDEKTYTGYLLRTVENIFSPVALPAGFSEEEDDEEDGDKKPAAKVDGVSVDGDGNQMNNKENVDLPAVTSTPCSSQRAADAASSGGGGRDGSVLGDGGVADGPAVGDDSGGVDAAPACDGVDVLSPAIDTTTPEGKKDERIVLTSLQYS